MIDNSKMFAMNVGIDEIVKHIGKNATFLQPLYEAVVNSLEAHADEITVEFVRDPQTVIDGFVGKIDSYTITDNGDGFIQDNIDSFNKLWSIHKMEMGCKGSGRFTWLNVFSNIDIKSEIFESKCVVEIPFSRQYTIDKAISVPCESIEKNRTIIAFSNCIMPNRNGKIYDIREVADIKKIHEKIIDYLLVKLFLFKKNNRNFRIILRLDNEIKTITNSDIPDLKCKEFSIATDIVSRYGDKIGFSLYYLFKNDNARSKKAFYCAHERTVIKIDDDALGFSASLPNNDSFIVLLCSNYFDDNVRDDRDGFYGLEGDNLKSRNFTYPLLMSDIKIKLKEQINFIIKDEYNDIELQTENVKSSAINNAPFLAKYIKANDDVLVTEESLIKEAIQVFNREKESVKSKFDKIIKDADINIEALKCSVNEVSEIALAELGEYILYRDKIIQAIEVALVDKTKQENYIHNIFMPKGQSSKDSDSDKHLLNNLWLIDDKFMSYSYVASNKEYNFIIAEIEDENRKRNIDMGNKRPDMTILYNKNSNKDVVVVEFKKPFATLIEKESAPTEIGRNIGIVKRNIKDVNSIYGYIITTLDKELNQSLTDNGYIDLFSTAIDGKMMYHYIKANNAHIFVLDLKTITADAFSRNKTFLDILKK